MKLNKDRVIAFALAVLISIIILGVCLFAAGCQAVDHRGIVMRVEHYTTMTEDIICFEDGYCYKVEDSFNAVIGREAVIIKNKEGKYEVYR